LISKERTCIDCHKGIAHELPDMSGIEPGWQEPKEERGRESLIESLRSYAASTNR
jgi:cytochrome c-type protein NapC